MNKKILVCLLIAILNISLSESKLSILTPVSQTKTFTNNSIKYSVSNYGNIPYGKRIIGQVYIPSNEAQSKGCEALDPMNMTNPHNSAFILIERGNCTFVTKSRNVQATGAQMAIIIDSIIEDTEYITMGDDGNGDTVQIPTIFISLRDGDILKSLVQRHQAAVNTSEPLSLVVDFYTQKVENVSYSFWIMLPSPTLIALVSEFDFIRQTIYKKANFTPHYFFYQNRYASYYNYSKEDPNCLGGGRYCCFDPDGDGVATGQDVAKEQLYQLSVFNALGEDSWWDYVIEFQKLCKKPQNNRECSDKIMKNLKYDTTKVKNFYDNSFLPTAGANKLQLKENQILNDQLTERGKAGILEWPSVSINNHTYKGKLQADNIMQAICVSYLNPPDACLTYIDPTYVRPSNQDNDGGNNGNGGSNAGMIIGIVVAILIVFFVFMVYCYKRMIKREMQQDIQAQVSQVYAQYVQFSENNQQKQANPKDLESM